MTIFAVSRRSVLGVGVCALAGGAAVATAAATDGAAEPAGGVAAIIRRYYRAWETKEWAVIDAILADDFNFTSAAPDDHISKAAFRKKCWDGQNALIEAFDLERVFVNGDEAFVRYVCHTKSGKSFRNVEYHRLKNQRIEAIECYFGGPGYPSAANKDHT